MIEPCPVHLNGAEVLQGKITVQGWRLRCRVSDAEGGRDLSII